MTQSKSDPYYLRRSFRTVSLVLGVLLAGVGIYLLVDNALEFGWRMLAGLVLAVIGAETTSSAYRGKEPWLAKLGPLP